MEAAMQLANRLLGQAQALGALIAYLQLDGGEGVDPALRARLDAVIDALDARRALDALSERERAVVVAFGRSYLHQAVELADDPARANRWSHEDPTILQAQGAASAAVASLFAAAGLGGPGARILDIGSGVARLSIAFCETFPDSTVVGLDPWPPAVALARTNIVNADLDSRITLVPLPIEDYDDDDGFDLVWLPSFFIPEAVLDDALGRVRSLLRPSGTAVVGVLERPDDPVARTVDAMMTVRSGGAVLDADEAVRRLGRAGFKGAREADRTWQAPLRLVVAQAE